MVTGGIVANGTRSRVAIKAAFRTFMNGGRRVFEGPGEFQNVLLTHLENGKSHALGAFRADPRQFRKTIDESLLRRELFH